MFAFGEGCSQSSRPEAESDTYPIDPYLIASKLTPDSVLAHHTALEFHGRAYSVWQQLTYLASRPLVRLAFRSHVYRGSRFPEALVRSGKEHFGVTTMDRAGLSLRVTSLERTLVDVLDRPHRSGGWEEIWRSLESVEFFDLETIVGVCHPTWECDNLIEGGLLPRRAPRILDG